MMRDTVHFINNENVFLLTYGKHGGFFPPQEKSVWNRIGQYIDQSSYRDRTSYGQATEYQASVKALFSHL